MATKKKVTKKKVTKKAATKKKSSGSSVKELSYSKEREEREAKRKDVLESAKEALNAIKCSEKKLVETDFDKAGDISDFIKLNNYCKDREEKMMRSSESFKAGHKISTHSGSKGDSVVNSKKEAPEEFVTSEEALNLLKKIDKDASLKEKEKFSKLNNQKGDKIDASEYLKTRATFTGSASISSTNTKEKIPGVRPDFVMNHQSVEVEQKSSIEILEEKYCEQLKLFLKTKRQLSFLQEMLNKEMKKVYPSSQEIKNII